MMHKLSSLIFNLQIIINLYLFKKTFIHLQINYIIFYLKKNYIIFNYTFKKISLKCKYIIDTIYNDPLLYHY